MAESEFHPAFGEEKQLEYEEEIRQRYGETELTQSRQRWGGYSFQQKRDVQEDFDRIMTGPHDRTGTGHDSPEVQARIGELNAWVGHFYDCTLDVFEGLGRLYNEHPDFRKM
jgi:TipAS antibiotic-recognition domain